MISYSGSGDVGGEDVLLGEWESARTVDDRDSADPVVDAWMKWSRTVWYDEAREVALGGGAKGATS